MIASHMGTKMPEEKKKGFWSERVTYIIRKTIFRLF